MTNLTNRMLKTILIALLSINLIGTIGCQSQGTSQKLAPKAFYERVKQPSPVTILDVRTPGEYTESHIAGAINIDINSPNFESQIAQLDKGKSYYVYCLSGGRSSSALSYMSKQGFNQVFHLEGGIMAWRSQNLPLESQANIVKTDVISADRYTAMVTEAPTVLIDFYAPWCAPCKKMEPDLEALQNKYAKKVRIVRINVDENKELAKQQGIDEIPVVKVYTSGTLRKTYTGYLTKESLENAILGK